jgi:NTE family protein
VLPTSPLAHPRAATDNRRASVEREAAKVTRAVVMGGGGPVGIAWEAGMAAGLEEAGVRLGEADAFFGTSAGSGVAAQLALGRSAGEIYRAQLAFRARGDDVRRPVDLRPMMPSFIALYTSDRPHQELRAEIGALALAADTVSEEEWLARFGTDEKLTLDAWPERTYACTAVDAVTGEFVVWTADSGVPLRLAVASSCAVPGVFPPITINGRRYMDGGMRSATNADVANGYGRVLLVSLTSWAGASASAAGARVRERQQAELEALRASGGEVEMIGPDAEFAQTFGVNLMDFSRRLEAAEMGLRQGRREAERVRAFWG